MRPISIRENNMSHASKGASHSSRVASPEPHSSQHSANAAAEHSSSVAAVGADHDSGLTNRKARSSNSETSTKRGSFSLQSGSYQYGLVPLNNSSYANYSNASVAPADFYTFPRRKMDSQLNQTPIIMKANGQLNNSFTMTSHHDQSAVSSPSVDSMYSSPALSPRHSAFNTSLNGRDDGTASVCSGSDTDSMTYERFYINEHVELTPASSTHTISEAGEDDEHPFFVGNKDIRKPATLQEMKIVSNKGTIRGVKNRVKGAIATFLQQNDGKPVKVCVTFQSRLLSES